MRTTALAFSFLLLAPAAGAETLTMTPEVTACVERNLPAPDSIRAARLTTRDRQGKKTITVVTMYGRRNAEGRARLFMKFLEPEDVRGSALLFLEQDGADEIYLGSPDFDASRRITAEGRSANLFGTDFSFEDFERLEGFDVPGTTTRLPDASVDDREVYMVESRPLKSMYERVVSAIDKKSCLPLRTEFFESGGDPRKVLTTDPRSNKKHGAVWVPHSALMRDMRDLTTTHLMVDSHEQDVLLPEGVFSVEALEAAVREGSSQP